MSSSKSRLRRRRAIFVSILLLSATLPGILAGGALATATPFTTVFQPIGIAYAPSQLLVTHPWCGSPREVLAVDSAGNTSVYATLPAFSGCREDYIAVSPAGLSGWPANCAYVAQGPTIYESCPASSNTGSFAPFVTLPSGCVDHTAMAFDTTGLFGGSGGTFPGHHMLATCETGDVFAVGPHGGPTASLVATVPAFIENSDIAPLGFAPYGGYLFTAAEVPGTVYAVSPAGVVSPVTSWTGAESVNFIPTRNGTQLPCHFGSSGGAFFTIHFSVFGSSVIFKYPPSDFAGLNGDALVPSELFAGIGLVAPPNVTSLFDADLAQHEGSTFVDHSVGCQ